MTAPGPVKSPTVTWILGGRVERVKVVANTYREARHVLHEAMAAHRQETGSVFKLSNPTTDGFGAWFWTLERKDNNLMHMREAIRWP